MQTGCSSGCSARTCDGRTPSHRSAARCTPPKIHRKLLNKSPEGRKCCARSNHNSFRIANRTRFFAFCSNKVTRSCCAVGRGQCRRGKHGRIDHFPFKSRQRCLTDLSDVRVAVPHVFAQQQRDERFHFFCAVRRCLQTKLKVFRENSFTPRRFPPPP